MKRRAPEARSLLVVQATGTTAKLAAFGPLTQDVAVNARTPKDVNHWACGGKDC